MTEAVGAINWHHVGGLNFLVEIINNIANSTSYRQPCTSVHLVVSDVVQCIHKDVFTSIFILEGESPPPGNAIIPNGSIANAPGTRHQTPNTRQDVIMTRSTAGRALSEDFTDYFRSNVCPRRHSCIQNINCMASTSDHK